MHIKLDACNEQKINKLNTVHTFSPGGPIGPWGPGRPYEENTYSEINEPWFL